MKERIHVVAGALFDGLGRVLIAQRPPGSHMAGKWEFPGGKLEDGEERLQGLRRELSEELGVEVGVAEPLIRYEHEYPARRVILDMWRVLDYRGEPTSLEGQALRWVLLEDLGSTDLLEADAPIVNALLNLPA